VIGASISLNGDRSRQKQQISDHLSADEFARQLTNCGQTPGASRGKCPQREMDCIQARQSDAKVFSCTDRSVCSGGIEHNRCEYAQKCHPDLHPQGGEVDRHPAFPTLRLGGVDSEQYTPWEPFHRLTRDAIEPVVPGEIVEYRIQILATANQFKAGHRICLDITSADMPTGTGGMSHVEYQAYHVSRSSTVCHRVYRDGERPSHLLLPIIPLSGDQKPETSDGD
jgi:hypothetical protein